MRLSTKADEIEQQGAETHRVMAALRARFGFSGMSSLGPCVYTLTDRAVTATEMAELSAALPEGTEVLQFPLPGSDTAEIRR